MSICWSRDPIIQTSIIIVVRVINFGGNCWNQQKYPWSKINEHLINYLYKFHVSDNPPYSLYINLGKLQVILKDNNWHCCFFSHIWTGAVAISSSIFGQGSGPIHLDDVACSGTERRLIDCLYTHIDNCVHSKDAGVRCQGLCMYTSLSFTTGYDQHIDLLILACNNIYFNHTLVAWKFWLTI